MTSGGRCPSSSNGCTGTPFDVAVARLVAEVALAATAGQRVRIANSKERIASIRYSPFALHSRHAHRLRRRQILAISRRRASLHRARHLALRARARLRQRSDRSGRVAIRIRRESARTPTMAVVSRTVAEGGQCTSVRQCGTIAAASNQIRAVHSSYSCSRSARRGGSAPM
jgi:hypothetical protein